MTLGTPNTYIELLTNFPPRPITAESELLATQKVIDSLIDKGELTTRRTRLSKCFRYSSI
jgi:HTH-type transcriptional regulator/antitoxin HigA